MIVSGRTIAVALPISGKRRYNQTNNARSPPESRNLSEPVGAECSADGEGRGFRLSIVRANESSPTYSSRSLKKVAISFDHDQILFSTANPADEVFGRHRLVSPGGRWTKARLIGSKIAKAAERHRP